MGDLSVMKIEEVGRAVLGFEDCQVLRAEMSVPSLTRKDRKEETEVCVVAVEQVQLAEIQRVVAWDCGKVGVQLVVGLSKKIAVRVCEDARESRGLVLLASLPI